MIAHPRPGRKLTVRLSGEAIRYKLSFQGLDTLNARSRICRFEYRQARMIPFRRREVQRYAKHHRVKVISTSILPLFQGLEHVSSATLRPFNSDINTPRIDSYRFSMANLEGEFETRLTTRDCIVSFIDFFPLH